MGFRKARPWVAHSHRRAGAIFLDFAWRQTQSCVFAFSLVLAMALTKIVDIPDVARYDFLFLICVGLQFLLIKLRWETWREAGVIAVFHVVGIALEWFKVTAGSWSYPEEALLKIGGVPLYAGFMHAAVASYMSRAWKRLDLDFTMWPRPLPLAFVLFVVYGQFFFPVQELSIRYATLALVLIAFARSRVLFTAASERLSMPVPLSFVLIGSFIYLAENIATYLGAWTYPYQSEVWQPVHLSKVISWSLLTVVSMAIVHFYEVRRSPAVANQSA